MSHRDALKEKIATGEALCAVIGLGYVGLPLAVELCKSGLRVLGVDLNEQKVAAIGRGESYIQDVPTGELAPLVEQGRLEATTDFSRLAEVDTINIAVPTPLGKTRDPDISFIVAATDQIARYLSDGTLVILESTTYPGTTEEVILPKLEATGRRVGEEIFVAFSPERVDPGNAVYQTRNIPKVVGGVTPACTEVAAALYARAIDTVVPVSTCRVAETVKLLENTFRSVNIGLVNEIAMICRRMDIDVWDVIDAAATKPFGFMPFYPGPGLGGHCIPIDPFYLSWKARLHGYEARFIELAGEINGHMPDHVVERVCEALNSQRKAVNGSRLLVLGVAYKNDIDDYRESPALDIVKLLQGRGAKVSFHDAWVPHPIPELSGVPRVADLSPAVLRGFDLGVIVTNHRDIDYAAVLDALPLVVDTRNAYKGVDSPKLFRL
ncbi:MAG: nucleotide sugar dehydrogenase [Candidatus Krumholzibacteriota bacterium]|nr:nucleotide sugar dehydrogenase [Candidatus Krumholzibacteriota bacterium]